MKQLAFLCSVASLWLPSVAFGQAAPSTTPFTQIPASGDHQRLPLGTTVPSTPTVPPFVPAPNNPSQISIPTTTVRPSPQPYLFSLQNKPATDVASALAANGVYMTAFDVAEYQGVTAGGYNHGSFATNWAVLGVNLDTKKIFGLPGGQIHFIMNDVAGQGRSWDYNASNWSFINNFGNRDGFQLRELTYDQSLFNDKVFILAGRSNPKGGEFEASELYCQFATFLCSSPTMFTADGSAPAFTTSTWGLRALFKPTPKTYVKGGIWEDEPWINASNHGSWPGEDWGIDKSIGAFVPVEMGYRSNLLNDTFPRAFAVGFTYDSATYNDPVLNSLAKDRLPYGGSPLVRRGRTTVYAQAQQMIWKPNPTGTRGLIAFGAANFLTSGDPAMRNGFVAGLFDWGPFASRPRDSVAIAFQTLLWDRRQLRLVDEELMRNGARGQLAGSETMMEINYGFNFAPGFKVTPYLEYIWHPDQMATSAPRDGINHAVQVGAMLEVDFNEAMDLPTLHRTRQ